MHQERTVCDVGEVAHAKLSKLSSNRKWSAGLVLRQQLILGGFSTLDETMDVARSAPQGAHCR